MVLSYRARVLGGFLLASRSRSGSQTSTSGPTSPAAGNPLAERPARSPEPPAASSVAAWALGRRPGLRQTDESLATLVERSTRFVMLVALPNGHKADLVAEALAAKITTLPAALARTLTWDQGHEMAEHVRFTEATGV